MDRKTRYCKLLTSVSCPGHQGWEKLPDCVIEALYGNDPDESSGTVDGFGTWFALYLVHEAEWLTVDGERKVKVPAGTFVVLVENNQGSVTVLSFESAEQAQAEYDAWDVAYGDYLGGRDHSEYLIVAGTGRIGQ